MSNVIISPNMLLPVPIQGQDPGPQYAIDINSCMAIVDGHNHSIGSGVQITPSGLNINTPLPMNNNILTSILALTFQPQTVDPGINSLYEKGVDLYYEDGNGNVIRITQTGSVVGSPGTITGLPSGTASASFAGSTFVFESSTLTPANIDGASFIFRNNVASSKGLTLSPPNAMGVDYSLVLPATPASNGIMTLSTAGNMSSVPLDNSSIAIVSGILEVPNGGITNIKLATPNFAFSGGTGAFSTNSPSITVITGTTQAITSTGGRLTKVSLISASNSTGVISGITVPPLQNATLYLTNATSGATFAAYTINNPDASTALSSVPYITGYQVPSSGGNTYVAQISVGGSSPVTVANYMLLVEEM